VVALALHTAVEDPGDPDLLVIACSENLSERTAYRTKAKQT
jgi:hypothetical protein